MVTVVMRSYLAFLLILCFAGVAVFGFTAMGSSHGNDGMAWISMSLALDSGPPPFLHTAKVFEQFPSQYRLSLIEWFRLQEKRGPVSIASGVLRPSPSS